MNDAEQRTVLHDYARGRLGTRTTIERLELRDFADLMIALARHDLPLPKPADTAERRMNVARASALLQPLLRDAG